MRYLSIFFGKKINRSDEPVSRYGGGQIIEWSDFVGPVAGCDANFEARKSLTVFYGEFDSGSERTLAAWIRHASRTGFNL